MVMLLIKLTLRTNCGGRVITIERVVSILINYPTRIHLWLNSIIKSGKTFELFSCYSVPGSFIFLHVI